MSEPVAFADESIGIRLELTLPASVVALLETWVAENGRQVGRDNVEALLGKFAYFVAVSIAGGDAEALDRLWVSLCVQNSDALTRYHAEAER